MELRLSCTNPSIYSRLIFYILMTPRYSPVALHSRHVWGYLGRPPGGYIKSVMCRTAGTRWECQTPSHIYGTHSHHRSLTLHLKKGKNMGKITEWKNNTVGTPYNTNVGVQKIPARAIWKPVVAKRNNTNPWSCSKPQILVTRDSRQVHMAEQPASRWPWVNFSPHAFITDCLTTL